MASPCKRPVAATQKIALVVPSGGEVDELLTSVLASKGWSIERADDNQHALARAMAEPFDLIITGRKTLGPEDVELLRKIRSARPHVRLIILTDEFTPGDVLSAMREGVFPATSNKNSLKLCCRTDRESRCGAKPSFANAINFNLFFARPQEPVEARCGLRLPTLQGKKHKVKYRSVAD